MQNYRGLKGIQPQDSATHLGYFETVRNAHAGKPLRLMIVSSRLEIVKAIEARQRGVSICHPYLDKLIGCKGRSEGLQAQLRTT